MDSVCQYLGKTFTGGDIMESPAKQITVYPGKMVEGLRAALALVAGFGAETASATRRKLLTRLGKRATEEHRDHVAHILMVGQRVPGYEEAFENFESMTEEEALEVFVCMARRSARWDRAYGRGDDSFGEVQQFLDRMAADRMAGQKMDLFHRLALEAIDELKRRTVLSTIAGTGEPTNDHRDMAFRNRENAASAMTKEQIAEAQRLIRKSRL